MKKIFAILLFSIFIFTGFLKVSFAQQTAVYDNPGAEYRLAVELFNKQKFGAAQKTFLNVIKALKEENTEIKTNAEYYDAVCAMELNNKDAEYKLQEFIKNHPANTKIKRIYFYLGKLQFNDKHYKKAIESFRKVDRYDLTKDEKLEYYFKTGYSYLKNKDIKKAKNAFSQIKDKESKYKGPATYYYAHIEYNDGNYDAALEGFNNLSDNRTFKKIIPYYIVHIYYFLGNYDKILEIAPPMFESATSKRKPEIARLIGDAYYRNSDYEKALYYFDIYERTSRGTIGRDDYYQLGFTNYKNGKFQKAIYDFQKVITLNDSLSQNAYYLLGDCYVETGQKKFARNAFLSAYKLDFDKQIKEDALFNYAKLSIEISHDPYNEAIKSLEQYIRDYPGSDRVDEAYSYLIQLFLSTKNYKAALASFENIKLKDKELNEAYQKIAFYRGIELFNDKKYNEAIELFTKSLKYNYNKSITAEANFWIGDAFFRLSNYWGAEKYYNIFLFSQGAKELPIYYTAFYNLGYIYFNKKEYSKAIIQFKKFAANKTDKNLKLVNDVYLRLGDCYYINSKFNDAITYYNKAFNLKQAERDYALYQEALSNGALGKFAKKISILKKLTGNYKNSPYYDDALYEIAITNILQNNNREAIVYFDKLVKTSPKSNYERKSLLKTGMIYYNNDQNDLGIKTLKKVITNYPGSSESQEALISLRNIYIDINKVNEFYKYAENLSFVSITVSEQDSMIFIAAENQYFEGNCEKAISTFADYIQKFPNGVFAINANYYKAECEFKRDSLTNALTGYEFVINHPETQFKGKALVKAAYINFNLKNYESALLNYIGMEENAEDKTSIINAIEGQMRCNYLLNNYDETINTANKLLRTEKVNNEQIIEAHFTLANSYMALGDISNAKKEFNITNKITDSEIGAESQYYVSLILFKTGEYKEAEKTVFELVDHYSSYDYWVAKTFILMADIYIELDNTFQAKQTLQSIIDNYEGPELSEIATKKLSNILEKEKQEAQVEEEDIEEDKNGIME